MIKTYNEGLFISAISAFEISLKNSKGKMKLPSPVNIWFNESVEFHGINEIVVNSQIAIQANQLPNLHYDPCDRMIIATAQLHNFILLTPDPLIQKYPNIHCVW